MLISVSGWSYVSDNFCSLISINDGKVMEMKWPLESLFLLGLKLLETVRLESWRFPSDSQWWVTLRDKMAANAQISKVSLCASNILDVIKLLSIDHSAFCKYFNCEFSIYGIR